MNTKQIDYCIELAHTLNFSRAAEECFHLVLCTHKTDNRKSLDHFIKTLQKLYSDAVAFPL